MKFPRNTDRIYLSRDINERWNWIKSESVDFLQRTLRLPRMGNSGNYWRKLRLLFRVPKGRERRSSPRDEGRSDFYLGRINFNLQGDLWGIRCKWSFSKVAVYEGEDHFPLAIPWINGSVIWVWFWRDIFRVTFWMFQAFKYPLYFRKYINLNSWMCEFLDFWISRFQNS